MTAWVRCGCVAEVRRCISPPTEICSMLLPAAHRDIPRIGVQNQAEILSGTRIGCRRVSNAVKLACLERRYMPEASSVVCGERARTTTTPRADTTEHALMQASQRRIALQRTSARKSCRLGETKSRDDGCTSSVQLQGRR